MLVLDSNAALLACSSPAGFDRYRDDDLVGPRLMWSEFNSALHEARWRRVVSEAQATATRYRLAEGRIREVDHPGLFDEAWRLADVLGLAKTYDAEYLALAGLLNCRMVTLDGRLYRAAGRLGFVVSPEEL